MKKIILGLVIGLLVSLGSIVMAAGGPATKSTNSTNTTKIIFNENNQAITRIDDGKVSCYIYTIQSGPALSCLKN